MFTRYETTTASINDEVNPANMQSPPGLALELRAGDFDPLEEGVEVIVKGESVRGKHRTILLS
jgi:hypothetical protein